MLGARRPIGLPTSGPAPLVPTHHPTPNTHHLGGEVAWGLAILVPIVLLGLLVPLLSPHDPSSGTLLPLAPPSATSPFGTDNLGRDVFTRTFAAAQLDIALALAGVAVPLLVGTLIGAVIGTTRVPAVAAIWTILIEGINAFPFIVLVIAIVSIVGPGVQGVLVGLALTNWARYARIARARALALREADFVTATEVLGYSRARVLAVHILPNVYSETLAYALSDFVIVVLAVAGLSFLGVGVRPPAAEWGAMMSDGRLFLQRAAWITVFPGLALSLTAVGVALVAQGIERRARGE
jgi:peptide/nickel transport system permease protein